MGKDIFDKVEKATVYGSGAYFVVGQYICRIVDVKKIDSQKDEGVEYGIVETRIVQTTVEEYEEGDTVTQRIKLTEKSAASNMKQFCTALGKQIFSEWSEDDVNAEFSRAVFLQWEKFCEENLDDGDDVYLYAQAANITTRKNKPFTKVTWFAMDDMPEDSQLTVEDE